MTTLQMLTLRRNAALGKLATLQRRAERLTAPAGTVLTAALHELNAALEEIQVATEQVQAQMDELGGARSEADILRRQLDEYIDLVPVACVWTRDDGEIEQANAAAAELLNVSAQRLVGRPLILFLNDRQRFGEGLTALNQGLARSVDLQVVLRPRERRPRPVRVLGRRLENDQRRCWFLLPPAQPTAVSPADA